MIIKCLSKKDFLLLSLLSIAINVNAAAITQGTGTKADVNSIAIGEDAWAITPTNSDTTYQSGQVAIGYHAKATGVASTSYGAYSLAKGFKSSSFGDYSQANGYKTTAFGTDSVATGDYSTTMGASAYAFALNSMAIGSFSKANAANSVALGVNSISDEGAKSNYNAYGLSTLQNSDGEVSVGSSTLKRKITNIAAGENDSDATNVSQLKSVNNSLTTTIDNNFNRSINFDLNQDGSVNFSNLNLNRGSGNVVLRGVANGLISSNSNEAINGSQLFETNQRVANLESSFTNLALNGNGVATQDDIKAANARIDTTNNNLDQSNIKINENTNNIIKANDNIKKNANDITTTNNNLAQANTKITNDIVNTNNNLAQSNVKIDENKNNIIKNTSDIAVTKDQTNKNTQELSTIKTNVINLNENAIQYDNNNNNKITLKGTTGTTLSNVANGVNDSDAVNVNQLNKVNQKNINNENEIENIKQGKSGIVRTNVVGNKIDASPTGKNSIAIGNNSKAQGSNSISIGNNSSDEGRDNTVSVGNATNKRTISNVSAGQRSTDAVNVSQLNTSLNSAITSANAYTDDVFSGVNHRINKLDKENKAGIAAAMAMASMPQAYAPGKSMVSLGVGNFQSESAISVGASVVAPEGKWVYKASGSFDSNSNIGLAAGAGYQW